MDSLSIWNTAVAAARRLARCYEAAMLQASESLGLPGGIWNLLLAAYTFAPDTISARRLRVRSPYTSPVAYAGPLALLGDHKFLEEVSAGSYVLTPRGSTAATALMNAAYSRMATLEPLPTKDLVKSQQTLSRLVEESLLAEPPHSKWSIIYSRQLDQSPPSSIVAKIDQCFSDLGAFRDDAHLASWRHHTVSGHAWDVLTVIWRNPACPIDEIATQLARRQWSKAEDLAAVNELRWLGWVAPSDELRLTENGTCVREASEQMTDEYFFAPWRVLPPPEIEGLGALLMSLYNSLERDCA